MSGADLENLANLAAIRASKEGDTAVRFSHMDWARDRILMGAERRSRFVSEESLRLSAYIEAGRALIANETDGSVPLHKMWVASPSTRGWGAGLIQALFFDALHSSLMPRGSKLSTTSQIPGMDQDSISKKEYIARSESSPTPRRSRNEGTSD